MNSGSLSGKLRQEAAKHLQLASFYGKLIPKTEIEKYNADTKQLARGQHTWLPKLEAWRKAMSGRGMRKKTAALHQVAETDDPVFALIAESYAASNATSLSIPIVEKIATFPEYEATRTLAAFSIFSPDPSVRDLATQHLKGRTIHDFVPLLLGKLTAPIDSSWRIYRGPSGQRVYVHSLYQQGPTENRRLLAANTFEFTRDPHIEPRKIPFTKWSVDNTTREAIDNVEDAIRLEAREKDRAIEDFNAAAEKRNAIVFAVLKQTTGEQNPNGAADWWEWWSQYNEVESYKPTRTLTKTSRRYADHQPVYRARSCFAAGVPIPTDAGMKTIETIQPGDRVLSQDVETGELGFRIVQTTTIRPPSDVREVTIGNEKIITTLGHPFWVTNSGWKMAKLLEVNDQLHSVDGVAKVTDVQPVLGQREAYNLIVEGTANYFVGESRVLVHDNTYQSPTTALLPGLSRERR